MPWIKTIDEREADGKLKQVYDKTNIMRGKTANIMKVHSLNPDAMKAHLDLYYTLMFSKTGLKREECEMIGVVVSSANKCTYCVNHHAGALNVYWKDDEKINLFIKDFKRVDLPEKAKCMLEYAYMMTVKPGKVFEEDIHLMKDHGFSDRDILNINLITSYFNFVNRIALGLGVEFTNEEVTGYKY